MKKRKRSKKLKKTRKGKKTKKVKKIRKPKKVLKKKVVKRKKAIKATKPKKIAKVKKPIKAKKPAMPPKPKKEVTAPIAAPIPAEKVPYTQENAILCICTKCPIQAESTCAGEKARQMEASMEKGIPEGVIPPPADLPGLYCSTGVATCTDLDFTKMCVCTGCPVWDTYGLATGASMGYFCRDGKAQ